MKKLFTFIFSAVLVMMFSAPAYAQKSLGLSINSYNITSIRPQSFRSVNGAVSVSLNSATSFRMTDITGIVYKNGRPFVQGSASDLSISRGSSTVTVNGTATLCNGIGLLDVLRCISFNPSEYVIDVSLNLHLEDGSIVPIVKKGVPLSSLMGR